MGLSKAINRSITRGAIHTTTTGVRTSSFRRSHICELVAIVALVSSCTTQSNGENSEELSKQTITSADENQKATAIKSFQEKFNGTLAPTIRPDKDDVGSILRRNEVYGQLEVGDFDFLEPKICDEFTIADLSAGVTGNQKEERLYQNIKGMTEAELPDVWYIITQSTLTDVDTSQLKTNTTRLSDIFFLSPDKRCVGKIGVSPKDGVFSRTQNFTSGNFPEAPTDGLEIFNYVQSGDERDGLFVRTVSLIILEKTKSAVVIVVTAFNIKERTTSVTSDDMLAETSQIGFDLKEFWTTNIQSDPDWLTINS
jgi:hypothetical protein